MHLDEMPVACMRSLMPCGSSSSAVIAEGLCPWQVGLMAVGPTSQPLSPSLPLLPIASCLPRALLMLLVLPFPSRLLVLFDNIALHWFTSVSFTTLSILLVLALPPVS